MLKLFQMEHSLTGLAVDSFIAGLTFADVLGEDVTAPALASRLADAVVLTGVGATRPFRTRTKQKECESKASHHVTSL